MNPPHAKKNEGKKKNLLFGCERDCSLTQIRGAMVWSTRHQDSKLIDVCTGAAAGRRGGSACLHAGRGGAALGTRRAWAGRAHRRDRPRHDSVRAVRCCAHPAGRAARGARARARAARRPAYPAGRLARVRVRCAGWVSARLADRRVALPPDPCPPRDSGLAANSVGFKQIKKCINTYKMHPAVRATPRARPPFACVRRAVQCVCGEWGCAQCCWGHAACGHLQPLFAAFALLCTCRLLRSPPPAHPRPLCVAPLAAVALVKESAACCICTRLWRSAPIPP